MPTAKSVFFLLAFGFFALSPTVFAGNDSEDKTHPHDRQSIVGSWNIMVTIPAGEVSCPGPTDCKIPAFATATSDGTVVQTAALAHVSTGHGIWKQTGPYQFTVQSSYFRFNPADNSLLGTSVTQTKVVIDPSGQKGSGTFTNMLFDLNGNPVLASNGTPETFSGTAEVTRVNFVP